MRRRRHRFRPSMLATFAVLVVVAGLHASKASAASLRVASLNAYLLSPIFYGKPFFSVKLEPFSGGKSETQLHKDMAHKVATRLCNDAFDYDVVALTEVWWEAAKDILRDDMKACGKGSFPYTLDTIDSTTALISSSGFKGEDSGLMIFSRYPLKTLPFGFFGTHYIFAPFGDDCAGDDCLADKGAVFVEIHAPSGDYNVVWTHTQSDDDYKERKIRAAQMATVHSLYTSILKPAELMPRSHRNVSLLMGDLNIVGNDKSGDPSCDYAKFNCHEWARLFSPAATSSFFATTLFDAWDHSMPKAFDDKGHEIVLPKCSTAPASTPCSEGTPAPAVDLDLGLTSPGRGSRLDYVEVSTARQRPCVQWMRLIGGGLSDHLGLAADINRDTTTKAAPTRCDPRHAYQPIVEWQKTHPKEPDGWQDRAIAGRLKYAGSMEWYRFEAGGTWAFELYEDAALKTKKAGLAFDVYEGSDLTEPIAQYNDETTTVKAGHATVVLRKFLVPTGPIFVRVYATNRHALGGSYQLFVHQGRCVSKEDACSLQPNQVTNPGLSPDLHFNADDTAWFELYTDAADSGHPQSLAFDAVGQSPSGLCSDGFTGVLRVLSKDGVSVLGESAGPLGLGAKLTHAMPAHFGPAKMFMTVSRAKSICGGVPPYATFTVDWKTNLAILYSLPDESPLRLLADETTSGPSTDDIYVNIYVDGVKLLRPKFPDVGKADPLALGDSIGVIRFVDRIDVQLEEEDNLSDNETSEEFTLAAVLGPTFPAPVDGLTESQSDTFPDRPSYQFINFDGGKYTFWYNLTRQLRKKTAGIATTSSFPSQALAHATAPAPALSRPAKGGPELMFLAYPPNGDGEIAAVGGGIPERNLTTNPALDFDPAYSPDGARIAFASDRGGRSDIYVMDAGGDHLQRLTRAAKSDTQPAWSPDGRRIAFTRTTAAGDSDLFAVPASGGRPRRLTRSSAPEGEASWSPDGRYLAFTRLVGRSLTVIFRLDMRTGRATRLTRGRNPAREPAWSPRGGSIAYTRGQLTGNCDVWSMNASGGRNRRLTNGLGPDRQPVWSPSGAKIAFARARHEGPIEIYLMRANGHGVHLLTPYDGEQRLAPDWRPQSH